MLSLFHGAVGYLDEVLALGIVIAVGVTIYFVFAVVESFSSAKDEQDHHEAH
jgi:uncharacterized membrane protein